MTYQVFMTFLGMLHQYSSRLFDIWICMYSTNCSCRNTYCNWTFWLTCGKYLDLKNIYYCSVSTADKHRLSFVHAVILCDLTKFKFLTPAAELCSAQTQFCEISSSIVISGCVGAIDYSLLLLSSFHL